MSEMSEPWWQFIRCAELDSVAMFLPQNKDAKILELGGMAGYQAKHIVEKGYPNITSIDIKPLFPQYFPVQQTVGAELKFDSQEFDVIYTSHVIAHIQDLETSFREMKRVTTDDAVFVHVVPSTTWTAITNVYHYLRLAVSIPGRVLRLFVPADKNSEPAAESTSAEEESYHANLSKSEKLKYMLMNPLGENPSFFHELFLFSSRGWQRLFLSHGFEVVHSASGPHFYSGFGAFREGFMGLRSVLGRLGFAGSHCFVLRKKR